MRSQEAIELALRLHAEPASAAALRERALPAGVADLLRLAGGNPSVVAEVTRAFDVTPVQAIDAARFFVEQQLLARECAHDAWRVLGARRGADMSTLREHRRLLVSLVHPDRSGDWAEAYSDRVHRAWKTVGQDGDALAENDVEDAWQPDQSAMARPDGWGNDASTPAQPERPMEMDAWQVVQDESADLDQSSEPDQPPTPGMPSRWHGPRVVLSVITIVAFAVAGGLWLETHLDERHLTVPDPQRVATPTPSRLDDAVVAVSGLQLQPTANTASAASPAPVADGLESLPEVRAGDTTAVSLTSPGEPDSVSLVPPAVTVRETPARLPTTPVDAIPHRMRTDAVAGAEASSQPQTQAVAVAPPSASRRRVLPASVEDVVESPGQVADVVEVIPAPVGIQESPPPVATPAALPVEEAAPASVTLALAGVPSDADAVVVLDQFIHHYAAGNLQGLLMLFSRQRNDGGAAVARDYGELFGTTRDRSLALSEIRWRIEGERLLGEGRFEARYMTKGRLIRQVVRGRVDFELVREGDTVRFARLEALQEGGAG
ncbi:MAG: hypothetical protein WCY72_07165 [Lysobacteraceae bacterium]